MTPIALESRLSQLSRELSSCCQEQERTESGFMEQPLITSSERRPRSLHLRWSVPVGSRHHGAAVGGDPHVDDIVAVALTHELTHVQLAAVSHFGRARVAYVRVVLPNHRLGFAPVLQKESHERFQRFGHVPITHILAQRFAFATGRQRL